MTNDSDTPGVGEGFCLVMELKDPTELKALMRYLDQEKTRLNIREALGSLGYIHYARFLPMWKQGLLLIVTEFDGDMQDYVMDFAAVLDEEFSTILSYMKGNPPARVSEDPIGFWRYVEQNTKQPNGLPYDSPFRAYPTKTVLDIIGPDARKIMPAPRPHQSKNHPPAKVDLADVQANVLRGFGATRAVHLGLHFPTPVAGRKLIDTLLCGEPFRIAPESARTPDRSHCINLGFTYAGLQALGLPQDDLEAFPQAFVEGPAVRATKLGDVGSSAPEGWRVGGIDERGTPAVAHAVVSLSWRNRNESEFASACKSLSSMLTGNSIEVLFEECAAAIDGDPQKIHFGYRDGIAQPRIEGVPRDGNSSQRELSPPGDFLLGPGYANSRGGWYIGGLRPELVLDGTYAALRIIEQKVDAFETLLDRAVKQLQDEHQLTVDRELIAAKLMGRWRDGTPLAKWPTAPETPYPSKSPSSALDEFDFVEPDDSLGGRCPVGAHIRRLNPRGGLVVGVPRGRSVIRRGMPYGPGKSEPSVRTALDVPKLAPRDKNECGLVGMFFCADLESQFEFLLRVWGRQDLSAYGLKGTHDPFIGKADCDTPFRFRPTEDAVEVEIQVPPLTRTAGSLYLLLPGLKALRALADR